MKKTVKTNLCLMGIALLLLYPHAILAQCNTGESLHSYCYENGATNTQAFELCPDAGAIVEAEIMQGTFDIPFNDNLTVYQGSSGSGIGGTILFGPMTGNVSGNIITATVAEECLVFIINSDPFFGSCSDGFELSLEVCKRSLVGTVSFSVMEDYCINAGVQTGLDGGSPLGGVYSGAGVTDDGNGMTYSFDPVAATAGTHTITYTVSATSAAADIIVYDLPGTTLSPFADVCIDAGVQAGLGGGLPTGGVYSGAGVTDDGNGMTFSFNPIIAGEGSHNIVYTSSGICQEMTSETLTVTAACACPVGEDSYFNCYDSFEEDVVIFEICPSAGMVAQAVILSGTYEEFDVLAVYQGASGSATAGVILFGPMDGDLSGNTIVGNQVDACLIFVSNSDIVFSCVDGSELPLSVCGSSVTLPVTFVAPDAFCIDEGVQAGLGGGFPKGGVYTGSGVADDGNGMTYSFDPAVAGAGVHAISYDLNGTIVSDNVEVFSSANFSFTAPEDRCLDAGTLTGLGSGLPVGGIYSGAGVTDDGNGMTYSFNPFMAGVGVHTVSYSLSGSCAASDDVEVFAACGCACASEESCYYACYGNEETNEIILEICPTAGYMVAVEIVQGSFDNLDDGLDIYEGASGSGISGSLITEGALTGNLAGFTFETSTANACLIFVSNSGVAGSCGDGNELGLQVCASDFSNIMFTALADLAVDAGVQTGLGGGTPAGGVYSGSGVTDDGNGTSYSFDPAVAGIGVHILSYTLNGVTVSDEVEVFPVLVPPAFSKIFAPEEIAPGSVTTLTFTIDNTASTTGLTDIAFTNVLPAGLILATPANILFDCPLGGVVSAPDGGTTISYTGGILGAGSACSFSVNVTSFTPDAYVNTTGDLTSNVGNSGTATDNLTVATDRPSFTKSFSPAVINPGERSTLTFTIDNSLNASNIGNGLLFTDNLPDGMVVAAPANAITDCPAGVSPPVITATPGSNTISYSSNYFNFSGFEFPAGASCTISVDVVGTEPGSLNNVTSDLSGGTLSTGKATAALEVNQPPRLFIQKRFVGNQVVAGNTVELEFTISNLDRDFDVNNIIFTDDLDAVLPGLVATGTPLSNVCGTGASLSGTSLLTFSGGTIPAQGSCTFSVTLQVPAGTATGTYINTTSAVTGNVGGEFITGNTATENLFIGPFPTITKTFLNNPGSAGGVVTLEFTITNSSPDFPAIDVNFTDNISAFMNGAGIIALPANGFCGASSSMTTTVISDDFYLNMIGGELPAGGSCTFTVDLSIPPGIAPGVYTNTTDNIVATVDGDVLTGGTASDGLEVLAAPALSKSFTDDPATSSGVVNLEFTISYSEDALTSATAINFTDDLNAVIPGMVATGLPLTDICGTGAQLSGTSLLTFSSGSLAPGESCTFSVPVQIPAGVVSGVYTNMTDSIKATVAGQTVTGSPANDDLLIEDLIFTKEFIEDPVLPGDFVTLRFTIDNTMSAFDATGITFTDNLGEVIAGMVAQAPLPAAPCGGASNFFTSGSTLIFVGGEVLAGASCSFDVSMQVPPGTSSDVYNNITSPLTATINGNSVTLPAASDKLTVNNNLIALSKIFTDDPVRPGGTVTVEYTITNLDPDNAMTDIAFTDDFDAQISGMIAQGLPLNDVCGTGAIVSGTSMLSFSGGSLAPGASCTFSITLETPATAPFGATVNCSTSDLTGTINTFPVIGDGVSDDLQFEILEFTKMFTTTVVAGNNVTLNFTITNYDPVNPVNFIDFSDDLDAVVSGLESVDLPQYDICGVGSALEGTSVINFTNGTLGPGESCSFDVTLSTLCSFPGGDYTNITSPLIVTGSEGSIDGDPATAILTIIPEMISPVLSAMPGDVVVSCEGDVPGEQGVIATDNCDTTITVVFTQTGLPLACLGNGIVENTWEAMDVSGNVTSYTQTVTVSDTTAAILSGNPADLVVECAGDVPGDPGILATDNCDASVTVVYTQTGLPLACDGNGTVTNTWTATDCNNNVTSYAQTVTVSDTTAPILGEMPADLVVECAGDVPGDPGILATDNCGASVTVVYTQTGLPLACDGNGTVTNTWVATDCNNNVTSYAQTVTVSDTTAPILSEVPADITINCNEGLPADPGITATDNCDGNLTVIYTPATTCGLGTIVSNAWSVSDCAGNVTSHTQTITIIDNVPPTVICQDITLELNANGQAFISASSLDNGSTDESGILNMYVQPPFVTCADVGQKSVLLNVTDNLGNVGSCEATVTVVDATAPNVVCKDAYFYMNSGSNVNVVAMAFLENTYEACGIVSMDVTPSSFDTPGIFQVDISVGDANGNVSTCSARAIITSESCPPVLVLNYEIPPDTYHASEQIFSAGKINTSDVVNYRAGVEIDLFIGFEVELGAEFSAGIEGCPLGMPVINDWEAEGKKE